MTTRTVSRRRRRGECPALIKGVLVAILTTVVLVIAFALIIALFGMSDGAIRVVNQLIKLLSVVLGVRVAVRRGDQRGTMQGALLGLIYMGVGVTLYVLLSGQRMTIVDYVIDLLTGIAAGGLTGMLIGSREPKTAK